jgi:ABC-type antimicrobial peptide transport system permease subunit
VTRRTREIGVRLALGATRADINRGVLAQGLKAVGLGTAIGLALSFFTAGFLSDLLWGIGATDPLTYLSCTVCLVSVGLAATWISTRRAMGIDPVEALRRE